jgi:hypothetical protein
MMPSITIMPSKVSAQQAQYNMANLSRSLHAIVTRLHKFSLQRQQLLPRRLILHHVQGQADAAQEQVKFNHVQVNLMHHIAHVYADANSAYYLLPSAPPSE